MEPVEVEGHEREVLLVDFSTDVAPSLKVVGSEDALEGAVLINATETFLVPFPSNVAGIA